MESLDLSAQIGRGFLDDGNGEGAGEHRDGRNRAKRAARYGWEASAVTTSHLRIWNLSIGGSGGRTCVHAEEYERW
jgi:hypothetical protein